MDFRGQGAEKGKLGMRRLTFIAAFTHGLDLLVRPDVRPDLLWICAVPDLLHHSAVSAFSYFINVKKR